jgi:hypothetical protein
MLHYIILLDIRTQNGCQKSSCNLKLNVPIMAKLLRLQTEHSDSLSLVWASMLTKMQQIELMHTQRALKWLFT